MTAQAGLLRLWPPPGLKERLEPREHLTPEVDREAQYEMIEEEGVVNRRADIKGAHHLIQNKGQDLGAPLRGVESQPVVIDHQAVEADPQAKIREDEITVPDAQSNVLEDRLEQKGPKRSDVIVVVEVTIKVNSQSIKEFQTWKRVAQQQRPIRSSFLD